MPQVTRRQVMGFGLVGGVAVAGAALPFRRSYALSLQPMDQGTQALYQNACGTTTHHEAALTALIEAARAREISVDEGALLRLLDGTPCPLCGCAITAG